MDPACENTQMFLKPRKRPVLTILPQTAEGVSTENSQMFLKRKKRLISVNPCNEDLRQIGTEISKDILDNIFSSTQSTKDSSPESKASKELEELNQENNAYSGDLPSFTTFDFQQSEKLRTHSNSSDQDSAGSKQFVNATYEEDIRDVLTEFGKDQDKIRILVKEAVPGYNIEMADDESVSWENLKSGFPFAPASSVSTESFTNPDLGSFEASVESSMAGDEHLSELQVVSSNIKTFANIHAQSEKTLEVLERNDTQLTEGFQNTILQTTDFQELHDIKPIHQEDTINATHVHEYSSDSLLLQRDGQNHEYLQGQQSIDSKSENVSTIDSSSSLNFEDQETLNASRAVGTQCDNDKRLNSSELDLCLEITTEDAQVDRGVVELDLSSTSFVKSSDDQQLETAECLQQTLGNYTINKPFEQQDSSETFIDQQKPKIRLDESETDERSVDRESRNISLNKKTEESDFQNQSTTVERSELNESGSDLDSSTTTLNAQDCQNVARYKDGAPMMADSQSNQQVVDQDLTEVLADQRDGNERKVWQEQESRIAGSIIDSIAVDLGSADALLHQPKSHEIISGEAEHSQLLDTGKENTAIKQEIDLNISRASLDLEVTQSHEAAVDQVQTVITVEGSSLELPVGNTKQESSRIKFDLQTNLDMEVVDDASESSLPITINKFDERQVVRELDDSSFDQLDLSNNETEMAENLKFDEKFELGKHVPRLEDPTMAFDMQTGRDVSLEFSSNKDQSSERELNEQTCADVNISIGESTQKQIDDLHDIEKIKTAFDTLSRDNIEASKYSSNQTLEANEQRGELSSVELSNEQKISDDLTTRKETDGSLIHSQMPVDDEGREQLDTLPLDTSNVNISKLTEISVNEDSQQQEAERAVRDQVADDLEFSVSAQIEQIKPVFALDENQQIDTSSPDDLRVNQELSSELIKSSTNDLMTTPDQNFTAEIGEFESDQSTRPQRAALYDDDISSKQGDQEPCHTLSVTREIESKEQIEAVLKSQDEAETPGTQQIRLNKGKEKNASPEFIGDSGVFSTNFEMTQSTGRSAAELQDEQDRQALVAAIQSAKKEKEIADIMHRANADQKRDQCNGVCDRLKDLQKELQSFDISLPDDADQLEQRGKDVQLTLNKLKSLETEMLELRQECADIPADCKQEDDDKAIFAAFELLDLLQNETKAKEQQLQLEADQERQTREVAVQIAKKKKVPTATLS